MSRSASRVRFLSFVCEKFFEGKTDEIREHTIAVEALGRKESNFESLADPIVRVTARVLRKKLSEYYASEGKDHPLQIVLPVGHYIPQFICRHEQSVEPDRLAAPAPAEGRQMETESYAGKILPTDNEAKGVSNQESAPISRFPFSLRKAIWLPASIAFTLSLVFIGGFWLGRGTIAHPGFNAKSILWGDPVWHDEFDGPARQLPDSSKWTFDVGNQNGWGNQELETYCSPKGGYAEACDSRRPNAFLDGSGHLVLRAQRNSDGAWTSARITTKSLKDFQYGRIEARMKLPVGAGLWPAFWMLGANFDEVGWPASGSVDLVENVSLSSANGLGPSMIRSTLHGPGFFKGSGLWHDSVLPNGARVDDGGFHTYGIIWSPGMIQFYVDDPANIFFVEDASELPEGGEWVFDHPFYIVLNLAVGGSWPGSPDATTPNPADVLVDYVRAYQAPAIPAPEIQWQPSQVKAGSAAASTVRLRSRGGSGRVYLSCSAEPAAAHCSLAASVVDLSGEVSRENTITISTASSSDKGTLVALPGTYKLTITATSLSGDRSQVTVPFEVKSE